MVLSGMYCSEQIVIPEKISNLLKTYAKAALKTQPYDLLRWSAAYFRCLSMDTMPPVKPRYEHDIVFGCLTKGYIKVLTSQLGKGFFVGREILEHRWSELCLPEDELLKFLSLTRMLYWPQVHWLKLLATMVGSINQSFHDTVMMLFELLTEEPEGGSSPVPLWVFRECLEYLATLDCSEEQTFFDGRKVLRANELEEETKMPCAPQKFSSTSFRNAVIDFWKFRIENDEKRDEVTPEDDKVCTLCSIPSSLRCGSEFNLTGAFSDPAHVIRSSSEFNDVVMVLRHLKCTNNEDAAASEIFPPCDMLRDIGPPWNWLHNFASHNCLERSHNFLERSEEEETEEEETPQPSDSNSASNEHRAIVEAICNLSTASEQGECDIRETASIASQLSEQLARQQLGPVDYERLRRFIDRASECGLVFNDLNALYNYFIQMSSREHSQASASTSAAAVAAVGDDEEGKAEAENAIMAPSSASSAHLPAEAEVSVVNTPPPPPPTSSSADNKNVESIFGESGIEVDNRLLEAKVSERMILGLVDKSQPDGDNVSDVASSNASMSSLLSNAETVRQVMREKDTQTMAYRDRVHERRLRSGSFSSSSLTRERQPYTCKIPPLPGIGGLQDAEKVRGIVAFVTQRSFEQGGFVYPRNLLEDDCSSLTELN